MDEQTVGERELKARLDLRRVKLGRIILITLGNATRTHGLDVWPQDLG